MRRKAFAAILVCAALLLSGCAATVPDLRGLDKAKATAAAADANLTPGSISAVYDATVAAGRVISQKPAPGTETTRGARVALVLSRGPEPARLTYGKLGLSRRAIDVGGKTVVSVKVSNLGDVPGRRYVAVTLDGKTKVTKRVSVAGHGSTVVSLPITSRQPGRHRLRVIGGPSGDFVVRRWVVVASLSGSRRAPKRLGNGMPYYPGMPAYHPDQLHLVRSRSFAFLGSTPLKLTWTADRDLGSSLELNVVTSSAASSELSPPGSNGGLAETLLAQSRSDMPDGLRQVWQWGRSSVSVIASGARGSKRLSRGSGKYRLEVRHANCDWTVVLWAKL